MLTSFQNLKHRAALLRLQARGDMRIVMRNIVMSFSVVGTNAKGKREFINWYRWHGETKKRLFEILREVDSVGFKDVTYILWFTSPYNTHNDYLPHEDVTDLVRAINLGK